MEKEQRREAKQHLVVLMHQGISWKEAIATVGVHISRSTAYRWVQGARKRSRNASKLYAKRCKLTKERAKELYHVLNTHLIELEQQGMEDWRVRKTIKEEKAVADAEIEEYQQRQWKAFETSNQDYTLSSE